MANAGPRLSAQDRKDLEKFTKFLIYKAVQVIVQSRLGYKVKTQSKPFSSGSDWFNLAIRDIPEVLSETKRVLASKIISPKSSLSVEISLTTSDGDSMVLEVWTLSMMEETDSNHKISYMVYNRMGILLKSLFCISRVTPAHRISRAQGPENYVICYRLNLGEPYLNHLGEGYISRKVGCVPSPIGKIVLNVSYRTKLLISPQHSLRDLSAELNENHFKNESPVQSPARPCQFRFQERRASCGDLAEGRLSVAPDTVENSVAVFCTTPPERGLRTSPRRLSAPSQQYYQSKTLPARLKRVREDRAMSSSRSPDRSSLTHFKTGAFAPARTPDEFKSVSDDIPFAGLYRPADRIESPIKRSQRRSDDPEQPGSNNSSQISAPDDFVMVELKTPFAERDGGPSDLGKFYRDCQGAPPLAMFDNQPSVEQTLMEINEQIEIFQTQTNDFDDFIDNLEVEH